MPVLVVTNLMNILSAIAESTVSAPVLMTLLLALQKGLMLTSAACLTNDKPIPLRSMKDIY